MTVQPFAADTLRRSPLPYRGGDGFEEFVHATADRLLRAAVLLCGDHHLAEDLTQTTYAKLYVRWATVSRAESPLAYARVVLTRTFLSHRRLRRTSERPVDVVPDVVASPADPGARLDLLAALRSLPARERAVVVLRYWEDLSVARTASVLGIRESTCRNRAARGLARLRVLLPELGDATPDLEEPT